MTAYERYRRLRDSFRACFERGEWRDDAVNLTKHAERVLTELRTFCRADESTFDSDARVHAVREGRREVWLRIRAYIELTDAQLLKLQDPDDPLNPQQKDATT